jgi:hypothetical protein
VIVSELADRYKVSDRTARRYVAKAYERFVSDIETIDKPSMIAKLVSILEASVEKSAKSGNVNGTVAACRTLIDLLGLAPQDR